MTDGRSASLSWNKAPIWGLRPDFYYCYYCQTVECLLMWSALSDERTGLSFRFTGRPRQRNDFGSESLGTRDHILLSQIRDFLFVVSYDSRGYGGGIRRRLHPGLILLSQSQSHIATDGQSISKCFCPNSYGLVVVGRPLWREDGSVFCECCWSSPA
jgi:hypothetical protein